MYILFLFLAWLMMYFAHKQYTVGRPTGLFYSDLGDYVTAFMYQPLINVLLISFVVTSMFIIYSSFYLILHKIIHHIHFHRAVFALQFALTLYLAIIGFLYFQVVSIVFFIVTIYLIIQDYFRYRRKRIRFRKMHF